MSRWTHHICDVCWLETRGSREPVRIVEHHRKDAICCYCGEPHRSGILVRENPENVRCKGVHPGEEE